MQCDALSSGEQQTHIQPPWRAGRSSDVVFIAQVSWRLHTEVRVLGNVQGICYVYTEKKTLGKFMGVCIRSKHMRKTMSVYVYLSQNMFLLHKYVK